MAKEVVKSEPAPPPSVLQDYAVMEFDSKEIAEIIGDNLGTTGLSPRELTRTKVPAGESAAMWSVPSPDGADDVVPALEGVIVYWQDVRAYWKEAFTGGGTPPDCSSNDCLTGQGDIGGGPGSRECADCPLSQFGTAVKQNGDAAAGQACRMMRLLFILRKDDLLPIMVATPPTSLKAIRQYFLQLASRRSAYHSVVTSLSLVKEKSGEGVPYYAIHPKMVGKLSPDEHERVRPLAAMLRPTIDVSKMAAEEAA